MKIVLKSLDTAKNFRDRDKQRIAEPDMDRKGEPVKIVSPDMNESNFEDMMKHFDENSFVTVEFSNGDTAQVSPFDLVRKKDDNGDDDEKESSFTSSRSPSRRTTRTTRRATGDNPE
jgi:hypothetical protein